MENSHGVHFTSSHGASLSSDVCTLGDFSGIFSDVVLAGLYTPQMFISIIFYSCDGQSMTLCLNINTSSLYSHRISGDVLNCIQNARKELVFRTNQWNEADKTMSRWLR